MKRANLRASLEALTAAGRIARTETAEGSRIIQITNWNRRVRRP